MNTMLQKGIVITGDPTKLLLFCYAFLTIICIALYGNSLSNGYCLDDAMVITENSTTQKGFSGIKEHFTSDYLSGYLHYKSGNAASPWRPIPLISYAIEIGVFGKNHPEYSHLINILLYTGCVLLIFYFLSSLLIKDIWLSFFATLLFAIHPIHSEVVTNIKSRDEILCLFFVIFSLIYLLKFTLSKRKISLVISLLSFFLALLSKENAITLLAGIPLILYFFTNLPNKEIAKKTAWYVGIAGAYFFCRINAVPLSDSNTDMEGLYIINYPFLNAVGNEAIFTKIYLLLKYLQLLFFPYPLSYDYSYNQIPYVNGSNPRVWIAILVYSGLFFYAIKTFKQKNIFSFCILLFAITFSLASNLFVDIAVTIGERLLFLPSLFFCIAITYLGYLLIKKIESLISLKKSISALLLTTPIIILCSFEIINRNKDWKDTDTLNLADYPKASNSIRVNDGVANYYLSQSEKKNITLQQRDSLMKKAMFHYEKALQLFPEFDKDLINMGVCYNRLGNIIKAEEYWDRLREINPAHPKLVDYDKFLANRYLIQGIRTNQEKKYDSSLIYLTKAAKYATANDSVTANANYHLAGMLYATGKYQEAQNALAKVLQIQPDNKTAKMGYQSCEAIIRSTQVKKP